MLLLVSDDPFAHQSRVFTYLPALISGTTSEEKHFGGYSQEWIEQNAAFLHYSGGFEIVRMFFYLNFSELEQVDSFLDGSTDDQDEGAGIPISDNLKIFRDMLTELDAGLHTPCGTDKSSR